jgi:hypothetical protein
MRARNELLEKRAPPRMLGKSAKAMDLGDMKRRRTAGLTGADSGNLAGMHGHSAKDKPL